MSSQSIYNIRSPKAWKQQRRVFRKTIMARRKKISKNENAIFFILKHLFLMFRAIHFPRKIFAYVLSAGLTGFVLISIILFAVGAYFARDLPEPGRLLERNLDFSTKIYDRTGTVLLYDIHGEKKRTAVKLEEISPYAKWATIVAEDKNFYRHRGFSITGIIRAIIIDVIRGGKLQGGSTITQQFVKNAVLSREKSYSRKLKELILAYRIEQKFSKDQILEMYFNEIPYGSTAYGIEAAAQTYLGKSSRDLDLVDAAFLAALTKAPTYYSPYGSNTEELVSRINHIINSMAEGGYISSEEAESAKAGDPLKRIIARREDIKAPHFVFYVKELLASKYGEDFLEQGGLAITTTLDWELQKVAEEEVAKGAARNEKKFGGRNAALVAIDPKTGQVLAMVGSRDYFDKEYDGNVNVALRLRQPGSSFKPIVYAAAFEKGYTPETILYDVETTFKTETRDYAPKNYDGKEHGPLSMRQALAGSLNIPAVKTIYLTGIDRVLNLAEKIGYTSFGDRSRFGLSLVLGGGEIKLLEHVAAFATLAREGNFLPTAPIIKIEDQGGKTLEEWKGGRSEQALDRNVARQITDILSDNNARTFIFGSRSPLILSDRPVAAKTGTTNDWRDGWTIGYTPSLVTGVWVGNNDNKPMKQKSDGVETAAPIWNAFMERALKGRPAEKFVKPDPTSADKPILRGEDVGGMRARIDTITGKRATEFTPPQLVEEKFFQKPHSILYFLNKEDPRGPAPEYPEEDSNFQNWEEAVLAWSLKQGQQSSEELPTLFDDVHTPQNLPRVSFTEPKENAVISSNTLPVDVDVIAARSIQKVEILIDGETQTIIGQLPYRVVLDTSSIPSGFHTITAKVSDDVLNQGLASITVNIVKQGPN